jgi:MFS family permease
VIESGAEARATLLRRRWWIALLLFLAGLINYFDRTIVSVALPAISKDFHLGPERMGVLLSAFFWSYAAMQVPIGWLADRFDLRWLYAGCFALWSVTSGLTGFASGLAAMIVLRALLGIGESIYLPGGMKLVSLLFPPKDRGLASGLVNCGTRAGLAFGAPLIAAIVTAYSWRHAYFLLGFVSLLWLIPWLAVYPRGCVRELSSGAGSGSVDPAGRLGRQDAWQDAYPTKLLGVCIANIGYGYYFYLLVTWLPSYLVQVRGMTLAEAGATATIPYLTFALGEPIGGWIADRLIAAGWDELLARKVVVTVAFGTGALLIPAGLAAGSHATVALMSAASLVGLSSGNLYALVQRIGKANVGFAIGLFNLAGNISGVAAPLVTGYLIAHTGSYRPAFVVAVVVLLAVLVPYWAMVRER